MIPSLEDRILKLLDEFLEEQVSFDEFESRFYEIYPRLSGRAVSDQ